MILALRKVVVFLREFRSRYKINPKLLRLKETNLLRNLERMEAREIRRQLKPQRNNKSFKQFNFYNVVNIIYYLFKNCLKLNRCLESRTSSKSLL